MPHTKGPWYEMTKGENHYQSAIAQEATGKTVALTYTSNDADAALISAAPALLEVLKRAAVIYGELRPESGASIDTLNIYQDILRIIARAEGR